MQFMELMRRRRPWRAIPAPEAKFCTRCGRELETVYPFVRYDALTGERIDGVPQKQCPSERCQMLDRDWGW